jgi:Uncharacterized protein conserved in bacteria (DUF2325).
MCAALVGGMDRMKQDYIAMAKDFGVNLKVFTGQERSIKSQLGEVDMMILCTAKVSHAARQEVIKHARANKIPLHMVHSSGLSSLRKCISDSA